MLMNNRNINHRIFFVDRMIVYRCIRREHFFCMLKKTSSLIYMIILSRINSLELQAYLHKIISSIYKRKKKEKYKQMDRICQD